MSKFVFTEKKLTEVVTKAVSDAFAATGKQVPSTMQSIPSGFRLESLVQLASFLGCSYGWAKMLKRSGRIRFHQEGSRIFFLLPDLLDAIENDAGIRNLFLKRLQLMDNNNHPVVVSQPKILVETELYPDRFIFAVIKYQGWRCNACIPYHLWNDPEKVTDFVEQIIRARNEKVPFKIAPAICPGGVFC